MICPACNNNQKHSDGMSCAKCRYEFVFNPKTDDTNDLKFSNAIKSVSLDGSAYFTFNQFYREFVRLNRFKVGDFIQRIFVLLIFTGIITYVISDSIPVSIGVVLFLFFVGLVISKVRHKPPAYSKVEKLFVRWVEKKKAPEGLLFKPSLDTPPPAPADNDVYEYGVEAILFVDKDQYVDLLVLNNIHTDLKALIVSKTGYPKYLQPTTKKILKNNPETPLFVIHDGINDGNTIHDVKEVYDIQEREIMDLGLFPQDFKQIKRLKKFSRVPNQPFDLFTKNELVNVLSISFRDKVMIAASAAMMYPNDDPSYGSFG